MSIARRRQPGGPLARLAWSEVGGGTHESTIVLDIEDSR